MHIPLAGDIGGLSLRRRHFPYNSKIILATLDSVQQVRTRGELEIAGYSYRSCRTMEYGGELGLAGRGHVFFRGDDWWLFRQSSVCRGEKIAFFFL